MVADNFNLPLPRALISSPSLVEDEPAEIFQTDVMIEIYQSLMEEKRKPFAIVGPPGCGKTTTLVWLFLQLKRYPDYVPILCSLDDGLKDVFAITKANDESFNSKIVLLIDMTNPDVRGEDVVDVFLNLKLSTHQMIMALSASFLAKPLSSSHLASILLQTKEFRCTNFTKETSFAFLNNLGRFTDQQKDRMYVLTNGIPRLLICSTNCDYEAAIEATTVQLFTHVLQSMTVDGGTWVDVSLLMACFFELSLPQVELNEDVVKMCSSVMTNLVHLETTNSIVYPKCCFKMTWGMLTRVSHFLYQPYFSKQYYVNEAAAGIIIFQSAIAGYLTKQLKINATQMFRGDKATSKNLTLTFNNTLDYTPPFTRNCTILTNEVLYNGHGCPGIDFVCVSDLSGVKTLIGIQVTIQKSNQKQKIQHSLETFPHELVDGCACAEVLLIFVNPYWAGTGFKIAQQLPRGPSLRGKKPKEVVWWYAELEDLSSVAAILLQIKSVYNTC